jgi:hypothetical protein
MSGWRRLYPASEMAVLQKAAHLHYVEARDGGLMNIMSLCDDSVEELHCSKRVP